MLYGGMILKQSGQMFTVGWDDFKTRRTNVYYRVG